MDRDSAVMAPFRRQLVERQPVVALLGGRDHAALGAIHEACAIAGRLDDLRVVDLAPWEHRAPLTAGHRAILAPDRPGPDVDAWVESVDHATDRPFGRPGLRLGGLRRRGVVPAARIDGGQGAFDPRLRSILPGLAKADLASPSLVLVVRASDGAGEVPACRWMVLHAVEAAEAAGRLPPLVLDPRGRLGALVQRLEWSTFRGSADAPIVGAGAVLQRAVRGLGEFEERWEEARERFEAALAPADEGGIRVLRAQGRTVFVAPAVRELDGRQDGHGRALARIVGEIGHGGWPSMTAVGNRDGDADDLLRRAFLARPGCVADPASFLHHEVMPHREAAGPVRFRGDAGGGRTWDAPALADFLAGACDLERVLAAAPAREPQLVHAWSRQGDPGRRLDFLRTWGALSDMALDGLGAAVDGGAQTLPLVAGHLGVAPAAARRLVGRDRLPAPLRADDGRPSLSAVAAAFPHDRLPAAGDAAEWRAFCACLEIAQVPWEMTGLGHAGAPELPGLLLPLGPSWAARLGRLVPLRDELGDARDMLTALAAACRRAGIGRDELPEAARRAASGGGPLTRVAALSRRWHAHPAMVHAQRGGVPPDTAWPVPFEAVDLGEGWTAMALPSALDLIEEGQRGPDRMGDAGLGHCVGGYGLACAEGRSLIVSLRRDGQRDSTVELAPGPDPSGAGWEVGGVPHRLVQHRGPGNARPGPESASALDRLLRALRTMPVDPAALAPRAYRGPTRPPEGDDLLVLWEGLLPAAPPWEPRRRPDPDPEPEPEAAAPRPF